MKQKIYLNYCEKVGGLKKWRKLKDRDEINEELESKVRKRVQVNRIKKMKRICLKKNEREIKRRRKSSNVEKLNWVNSNKKLMIKTKRN